MIDFPAPAHGVLSQNFRQHLQDLFPADPPAFDPAADHSHMLHHRLVPLGGTVFGHRGARQGLPGSKSRGLGPALIEGGLLLLALGISVIGDTTPGGLPFAVGFPAPEGATQVMPPGIARVGEKENAAMPAPGQAGSQERLGSQNRSQKLVILQDQGDYLAPAIPVRRELKMLLNPGCKKPKLSLKMLTQY